MLAETGTTGVLVTHDQDEALSTADRVAVLRDGRIAQCAAPQDLYDRPADADIARFIGDANLIEGVLDAGMVDTVLGRLRIEPSCLTPLASGRGSLADGPAARRRPGRARVRPGHRAGPAGAGGAAGRRRPAQPAPGRHAAVTGELTGRVVAYGYHGHDAVIHVRPEHEGECPRSSCAPWAAPSCRPAPR